MATEDYIDTGYFGDEVSDRRQEFTHRLPTELRLHITKHWRKRRPVYWAPKGGSPMTLESMDNQHLINAAKIALRFGMVQYQFICQELAFRFITSEQVFGS